MDVTPVERYSTRGMERCLPREESNLTVFIGSRIIRLIHLIHRLIHTS